jgi:hypothetical protein
MHLKILRQGIISDAPVPIFQAAKISGFPG